MPFREEILDMYPRAIQELTRRGVSVGYDAANEKYILINKQGIKKVMNDSELQSLENKLKPSGNLKAVSLELSEKLL